MQEEELDGVGRAIKRGYTMLAIDVVKYYIEECRLKKIKPKHLESILHFCGLETLINKIGIRSMRG